MMNVYHQQFLKSSSSSFFYSSNYLFSNVHVGRFHDEKIYVANGEKYIWTLKNEFDFSCKKKEEELDFKVIYIKHLLYFLIFLNFWVCLHLSIVYFGEYFGTAIHTYSIKFEAHFTFIFCRQIIMYVMMTANYSIK